MTIEDSKSLRKRQIVIWAGILALSIIVLCSILFRPKEGRPYNFCPHPTVHVPISNIQQKSNLRYEPLLWEDGSELKELEYIHAFDFAWSPDDNLLAVASATGIYFIDFEDLELVDFIPHEYPVTQVTFNPDGGDIAWLDITGTVTIANNHYEMTFSFPSSYFDPIPLVFSQDGVLLATIYDAGYARQIQIRNSIQPNHIERLIPTSKRNPQVLSIDFSPDRKFLAYGTIGDLDPLFDLPWVVVWDIASSKEVFKLKGHTFEVRQTIFDPSGEILITASPNETIVWDCTGKTQFFLPGGVIDLSSDGKLLALGSANGDLSLWDPNFGLEVLLLMEYNERIDNVKISNDMNYIAVLINSKLYVLKVP